MEISHFTHKNQQSVTNFWQEIYKELGWNVSRIDGFDDIPKFFHLPKGFLLIMKDIDEKIVGCGGVKPLYRSTGVLKKFYLAPLFRGKGVAKQLLDKIIIESKKRGISKLVLDVYYTNFRAAKFLKNMIL
jgi:GNAT superfamily N-acetyltransferase